MTCIYVPETVAVHVIVLCCLDFRFYSILTVIQAGR